jgi:hypothetical protein
MTKKTTMIKPKPLNRRMRRKQERLAKKVAKRAARLSPTAPVPEPEEQKAPEAEEQKVAENEDEYQDETEPYEGAYSETVMKPGRNGMPGLTPYLTYKRVPQTNQCLACLDDFCGCAGGCSNGPARLQCLCAPTLCGNCIAEHALSTGTRCPDPTCGKVHFNCPSCRKGFNHVGI